MINDYVRTLKFPNALNGMSRDAKCHIGIRENAVNFLSSSVAAAAAASYYYYFIFCACASHCSYRIQSISVSGVYSFFVVYFVVSFVPFSASKYSQFTYRMYPLVWSPNPWFLSNIYVETILYISLGTCKHTRERNIHTHVTIDNCILASV